MGLFDKERERDGDVNQAFFVTNASFESRGILLVIGVDVDVDWVLCEDGKGLRRWT